MDLGTGPATQAIWLVKRGFNVIGSDLSEAAINRARKVYASEKTVNFIVDNILNTKLKSNEFNYIFDRGCFHVLSPRDRKEYINKVKRILKDNGILFLKCFSDKEPQSLQRYHPTCAGTVAGSTVFPFLWTSTTRTGTGLSRAFQLLYPQRRVSVNNSSIKSGGLPSYEFYFFCNYY
jgi:ubiquinone/menaquinone biosynthesis C-methylase UbiE